MYIKVHYELDGKKKIAPFDNFQFRTSNYQPELDESVHGIIEIPNSTPLTEDDMKVGLQCFGLWHGDNKYYKVVVTEIQKKDQKLKRKGMYFILIRELDLVMIMAKIYEKKNLLHCIA